MKEEYHKWNSQYLDGEFEMLVFGHDGIPVILFPTTKGKYYQNKDFGLVASANHLVDEGKIKIYCPDSADERSWYNYSIHPADRVKTHIGYENLILNDVIEFAKYETGRKKVTLAGCSFGAYHAANLALRHPDKINNLISMSGSFDIKKFIMGYYDDNCYFNNPVDYLPNLTDEWYLDHYGNIGIILGTGEWDFCLEDNRQLSEILNEKNIPHWLDVRNRTGHDWQWWCEMFPHYLNNIFENN